MTDHKQETLLTPDVQTWDQFWETTSFSLRYNRAIFGQITAVSAVAGERILEVGAGRALESIELAKLGADVTVLDYSVCSINIITRLAEQAGVSLHTVQGDALALPFPEEAFDFVFHQGLIEHFSDPLPLLAEQQRVLKPGGRLLVDVPQKYCWYTLEKHVKHWLGLWKQGWETQYSIGELETLAQRIGFKLISSYGWGYYPNLYHKFRYLHNAGLGRFNRPYLPGWIRRLYNGLWERIEQTRLCLYYYWNIGIVAEK